MPKRTQKRLVPWGNRVGSRRIRAGLGVRDPRNMTREEKKVVARFYAEKDHKPKRYEKGVTARGGISRMQGRPCKRRSGKIIPLAPELIPQENKVIELPEGKFRYRTVMTLVAPMPKRKAGRKIGSYKSKPAS